VGERNRRRHYQATAAALATTTWSKWKGSKSFSVNDFARLSIAEYKFMYNHGSIRHSTGLNPDRVRHVRFKEWARKMWHQVHRSHSQSSTMTTTTNLTAGAIHRLAVQAETDPNFSPVLQVVQLKALPTGDRYRVSNDSNARAATTRRPHILSHHATGRLE
jgi:hypothetical protein